MTYLIAAKSGFTPEDAKIIAYSAQYVDDNNEDFVVDRGKETQFVGQMSQTKDITKPCETRLQIYPVFHFIPGDPSADTAKRWNEDTHFLNTTPNSVNANNVFKMALDGKDLYRIGLACHGYVDTWAHQNFVGYKHPFNAITSSNFFLRMLNKALPNIGHADGHYKPDMPALIWKDHRLLKPQVDNKARFLEAAENLLEKFIIYNAPETSPEILGAMKAEIRADLDEAIGEREKLTFLKLFSNRLRLQRIKRYKVLAERPEYGGQPLAGYKKDVWFKDAIESQRRDGGENRTAGGVGSREYVWIDKADYQSTHWYKFQSAVIQHQAETLAYLKEMVQGFSSLFKEPEHLISNTSSTSTS